MPVVNITLKDGASEDKLEQAKQGVKDHGGKIINEFRIIKGFTAEIPDDKFTVMQSHDGVHVEKDQEVRTQ